MPRYQADYDNDLRHFREYRRKHPIRSAAATKERPQIRKIIIDEGYRPYPADDCWDGFSAFRLADKPDWPKYELDDVFDEGPEWNGRRIFIDGNLKKQMRKMIAEGYFARQHSPRSQ
jgi:hypothetical protein